MNGTELPNDIRELDKLYESPEDEIKRLTELCLVKGQRIKELTEMNKELQDCYSELRSVLSIKNTLK